ncbi:hypothetical protein H310_05483 [Aphanomyces invadans]|uniref:Enoyl reductase (ER) domain-containing protein n=2 Tax=Aphanomyces invadans TaxID=157072 RepID=A0A024UBP9_9STRA|nr:hypothetical protein H310_05483 [Aphanomyces invadans]ETW03053.1 hypothetical protein H310_05483 [Aphanomyces invadans]|eukprot:XP_008868437.1 hypothetical protein H310_05483 [Aphanomyces invadans]
MSTPSTMQAIDITTPGEASVLQIATCDTPVPREGEVLIKVYAAGLNRLDILQRKGIYPPPPGASSILGLDVAGEIVAFGPSTEESSGWKLGENVCALLSGGGYAQYAIAVASHCLPVPNGWSYVEAASLPEAFFTVWSNVFQRAKLSGNDTFLVQGGSSGIGITAIQLAKAFGHRVFATAGSAKKCRECEAFGADAAMNYREEDFVAVVKAATNDRGVDVILDMVGGDYIPREIEALANDGRIVMIALQRGAAAQVDLAQILRRRLTLTGSTLRTREVPFKAAIAADLKTRVWPLLEAKTAIKPAVYKVFPLKDAAAAHELMETSAHVGKIVLQVIH